MKLEEITRPVADELEEFNHFFRSAMRSKVAFVDLIARYIIRQKGKRIRPALVLLTAKACGMVNDSTYRGASLVEILHTATLIHDDVVDDADTRRGLASINAVWKNKIAVLMGDYMLAKGLLLSLDHNDFQFLKITSDAVRRMSEAEILQIAKSRDLDIDEATYLQSIVEFAHEFGGIDYTTRKAELYSNLALEAIEPLPESPSKEALRSFVGFVLERSK